MNAINKVWCISDLCKMIGSYKHQFEVAKDVQYLSNNNDYQHLLYHIYNYQYDTGVTIRKNSDRMRVKVCTCNKDQIVLTFELFEKCKRIPYYYDTLFLNKNKQAIDNQRKLAVWIINDPLLLPFFKK